jgi:hypothetical protein
METQRPAGSRRQPAAAARRQRASRCSAVRACASLGLCGMLTSSFASTSAPAASSAFTASAWPSIEALKSGVHPSCRTRQRHRQRLPPPSSRCPPHPAPTRAPPLSRSTPVAPSLASRASHHHPASPHAQRPTACVPQRRPSRPLSRLHSSRLTAPIGLHRRTQASRHTPAHAHTPAGAPTHSGSGPVCRPAHTLAVTARRLACI